MSPGSVSLLRWFSWDRSQAGDLLRALAEPITDIAEIKGYAGCAGVPIGQIDWSTSDTAWRDVIDHAADDRSLQKLADCVRENQERIAVAEQVDEILAVEEGDDLPYECDSLFEARLITGFPDVFVNRVDVRGYFSELLQPSKRKVVVINGPRLSGKTYTQQLINHIKASEGIFTRRIDFETLGDNTKPKEVMIEIAKRLKLCEEWRAWLEADETFDETAQGTQQAQTLLGFLQGELPEQERVWWLMFDSLDKVTLDKGTVSLLQGIARAAQFGELGQLRVVLCGFEDDMPAALKPYVLREDIAPIGKPELVTFFQTATQHVLKAIGEDYETLSEEKKSKWRLVADAAADDVLARLEAQEEPEDRAAVLPLEVKNALVAVFKPTAGVAVSKPTAGAEAPDD